MSWWQLALVMVVLAIHASLAIWAIRSPQSFFRTFRSTLRPFGGRFSSWSEAEEGEMVPYVGMIILSVMAIGIVVATVLWATGALSR